MNTIPQTIPLTRIQYHRLALHVRQAYKHLDTKRPLRFIPILVDDACRAYRIKTKLTAYQTKKITDLATKLP